MNSFTPGSTGDVLHRFNQAFLDHTPEVLPALVADDCRIERIQPTADGDWVEGGAACRALWQAQAADRSARFELEGTTVHGEIGLIFWTYRHGPGLSQRSRGVNVMRVRDGQVVEGRGYAKKP
jgi:ketosteroid isomerase-like protein